MILALSDLPSDPEQLKGRLIELACAAEEAAAQRDAALAENEKLLFILAEFKRALFGKRSEKLDPDQLQLIFDLAAAAAATEDADESREASAAARKKPRKAAERNRGKLPEHLPRIEIRIDPEAKTCSCCGGALHVIGETVSEMLDIVPVQYRVKRIIRPRYGCRGCENAVVQAPRQAQPVDGGIATEALLAAIAVGKFAWHLPLNRQLRMMRAQGIELDRSTLSLWIGRTAWWLKPLYALLLASILARPKIFCDETPMPVFARGGTRRCQFWAVAVDDRPWAGPAPPAVAYAFAVGRKTEHAMTLLDGFSGILSAARLDGGIRIENPGLGQQWRRAVIEMALQPFPALVLSDGLEAAPDSILADDLPHAQQLGQNPIAPQRRDVGIALMPGKNRQHRCAKHVALLRRVRARIGERAIGHHRIEQARNLQIFDEERELPIGRQRCCGVPFDPHRASPGVER